MASEKAWASGKRVVRPMLVIGTSLADTASGSWSVLTVTGMKGSGRTTASMAKAKTPIPTGMHSSAGTNTGSIMETVSTPGQMGDIMKGLSRMARKQGRGSGSRIRLIRNQTATRESTWTTKSTAQGYSDGNLETATQGTLWQT